jgi:hypothetical protein
MRAAQPRRASDDLEPLRPAPPRPASDVEPTRLTHPRRASDELEPQRSAPYRASAEVETLRPASPRRSSSELEPLRAAPPQRASAEIEPLRPAPSHRASAEVEPLRPASPRRSSSELEPLRAAPPQRASAEIEPLRPAPSHRASAEIEPLRPASPPAPAAAPLSRRDALDPREAARRLARVMVAGIDAGDRDDGGEGLAAAIEEARTLYGSCVLPEFAPIFDEALMERGLDEQPPAPLRAPEPVRAPAAVAPPPLRRPVAVPPAPPPPPARTLAAAPEEAVPVPVTTGDSTDPVGTQDADLAETPPMVAAPRDEAVELEEDFPTIARPSPELLAAAAPTEAPTDVVVPMEAWPAVLPEESLPATTPGRGKVMLAVLAGTTAAAVAGIVYLLLLRH